MAEPFIGEIMIAGFNFAPRGYSFANGSLIAIRQNTALFSLIGTTYGGDGTTTFQLPNLASMAVCGAGSGPGLSRRTIGEQFGEYSVTLQPNEMPAHTHSLSAYGGRGIVPDAMPESTSSLSQSSGTRLYGATTLDTALSPAALTQQGGNMPHNNCQPYLGLNYSIALQGTFPSFG